MMSRSNIILFTYDIVIPRRRVHRAPLWL